MDGGRRGEHEWEQNEENHATTRREGATGERADQPSLRRPCSDTRAGDGRREERNNANDEYEERGRNPEHEREQTVAHEEQQEHRMPPTESNCRGADLAEAEERPSSTTPRARDARQRIHQYSDGAWEEPDEYTPLMPAGYGVVEFEETAATGRAPTSAEERCDHTIWYEMGQRGVNGASNSYRARMTWA